MSMRNDLHQVSALGHEGVEVSIARASVSRVFLPHFTVLIAEEDPALALRWGQFSKEQLGVNANPQGYMYNVPTWGRAGTAELAPGQHVEDGLDPQTDQAYGEGRTANYFNAAPRATMSAVTRERTEGQFRWASRATQRSS